MFGYVMADVDALSKSSKARYGSVYCGICRQIRERSSNTARVALKLEKAGCGG